MSLPPTLGSLALSHQLQRNGLTLRAEVQRHGQELSTGRAADPTRHLRGDLGALALVQARLGRIGTEQASLAQAATTAAAVQTVLGRIADLGESIRGGVLLAAGGSANAAQVAAAGRQAMGDLGGMIAALSTGSAGAALFSGDRPDQSPLPPAGTVVAAFAATLGGAPGIDDILAAADAFFLAPGGGYETQLYAGGAPVAAATGGGAAEADLPTALHSALRQSLRDAALASLLDAPAILPDPAQRHALAVRLATGGSATGDAMIALRGTVGQHEAGLEGARLRLSTEGDALAQRRAALVGVDPYDAASQLEEARARLEALYVVTARVARLSLTEYLR